MDLENNDANQNREKVLVCFKNFKRGEIFMNGIQLIAGTSHPDLAQKISKKLEIPLTPITIKKFANGEIYVRLGKKCEGMIFLLFKR